MDSLSGRTRLHDILLFPLRLSAVLLVSAVYVEEGSRGH